MTDEDNNISSTIDDVTTTTIHTSLMNDMAKAERAFAKSQSLENNSLMDQEDDNAAVANSIWGATLSGTEKLMAEQKVSAGGSGKQRKITARVSENGNDSLKNYLKTMCNHELLNKNEEIILAREIQILIKWEEYREQLETQLLRYVID